MLHQQGRRDVKAKCDQRESDPACSPVQLVLKIFQSGMMKRQFDALGAHAPHDTA